MESIVLEEKIDPNYELTEEEYLEYIESLGIVLPEDNDLLYIVHEALKAQLPPEWKPCQTADGQVYYFNFNTGESLWDHPVDIMYREKVKEAKEAKKVKKVIVKKPKQMKNLKKSQEATRTNTVNSQSSIESQKIVKLKLSDSEESVNSEVYLSQKVDLRQEYLDWAGKLTQDYEEKKENERKLIQKSLDEKKTKILAQNKEKEEELRNRNKEKIEKIRKGLDRDLQQREKIELEALIRKFMDEESKEFEEQCWKSADDRKKKLVLDYQDKSSNEIEKFKIKAEDEMRELRKNLIKYQEKFSREVEVGEKLSDFYSEKLEKLKTRLDKNLALEKSKIPEQEIHADPDYMNEVDIQTLTTIKTDLEKKLKQKISDLKSENSTQISSKLSDLKSSKTSLKSLQENFKLDLINQEQNLSKELQNSLNTYKTCKSAALAQDLQAFKTSLITSTQNSSISSYQVSIKALEQELNSVKSQLKAKTSVLESLEAESKLLLLEQKPSNPFIESSSIFSENQSPIRKYQFISIESDLDSIKHSIIKNSPSNDKTKLVQAVLYEKNKIKSIKKSLAADRQAWQTQLQEFRICPHKKKYSELLEQKNILDQKIKWHNWRVREIKLLEQFFKSGVGIGFDWIIGNNSRVDTELHGKNVFG